MELITQQPLCWIQDNEWTRHYKECTLEDLQQARKHKVDILTSSDEVLTDYQVAKYWKADIIDRYIYFVIPKIEPYIQTRFKTMILNFTKQQRENITYEWIKIWVEKQRKDEEYYK